MDNEVVILHLSDLHFGKENELDQKASDDRTNILNDLIDKLVDLSTDWKPNIVVISGDIGNQAEIDDYKKASEWINRLISELNVPKENVIVAPGNHDRNLKSAKALLTPATSDIADDCLSLENVEPFIKPFDNFQNFCKEFGLQKLSFPESDNYLFGKRTIENLDFIVLNSAWFYKPKENEKGLWLGLPHLIHLRAQNMLIKQRSFNEANLTIGIFHHPPREYLAECENHALEDRVPTVDLFSKHAHVFLCGHIHAKPLANDKYAQRTLQIIAGATYTKSNYPNSFNLLKIKFAERILIQKVFCYDPSKYEWEDKETFLPTPLKSIDALTSVEKKNEFDFKLAEIENRIKEYFPISALKRLRDLELSVTDDIPIESLFQLENIKAFALLEMHKLEEAAQCYYKSSELIPTSEKGIVNRIFSLFLTERLYNENPEFQSAIKQFPTNALLNCIKISIEDKTKDFEILKSQLPQGLLDKPEILYSLGKRAEENNKEIAKEFYEAAANMEGYRKPTYQASFGSFILGNEIKKLQLLDSRDIPAKTREVLEKARNYLNLAWQKFRHTEQSFFQLPVLLSLAAINDLLGDTSKAIGLIDEGLEIDPNSVDFLIHKGRILTTSGGEDGVEILKKVISISPEKDITLIFAAALMNKGNFTECIESLTNYLAENKDQLKLNEAERLLINCYIAVTDYKKARKISEERLKRNHSSCEFLIERARIERVSENFDEALKYASQAKKQLTNDKPEDILAVANELYVLESFEDAYDLLIANYEDFDTTGTRLLVKTLYSLGKENEILEICKGIRKKQGLIRFYVDFEYHCYEKAQDYNAAKEILQNYLKEYPKEKNLLIRLAIVNSRLGLDKEVDLFLESDHELKGMPWQELLNLAYLYHYRDKALDSIKTMYEARRRYYNQKEVHLAFIHHFLNREKTLDSLFEQNEVSIDSFVELQNQFGEKICFILENRPDLELQQNEINQSNPWFNRLIGNAKGQSILVKGLQEKKWEIIDVKHKFVHAFQKSLKEHEVNFPEDKALQSIVVGESPNPKSLEPILQELNRQKQRADKIIDSLKKREIPICTFANMIGKDYYTVWSTITSRSSDLRFFCSKGDSKILQEASLLFEGSESLILTPFSIMTFFAIGIEEILSESFKLSVTESTIEFFERTLAHKIQFEKNGYQILSSSNDKFVSEAIPSDYVAKEIEFLQKIVAWLKEKVTTVPIYKALDGTDQDNQRKFFGKPFFDSILAASEERTVLVCDDAILRDCAGILFDTKSIWSEILLRKMLDSNKISSDKFNKLLVDLIEKNYTYLAFGEAALYTAAERSNWQPTYPLTKMTELLGNDHCDEYAAISISVNLIKKLAMEKQTFFRLDNLIFELLKGLFRGRKFPQAMSNLVAEVNKQFSLLPLQKRDILDTINIWSKGNLM